jgi:signal transduction histidine kinase
MEFAGQAAMPLQPSPLPPAGPPRAPTRLAAATILGFWTFYYATNTLRSFVTETPEQLDMAARRLAVTVAGMGLTWLLYLWLRRISGRTTAHQVRAVFFAAVPLSLAYSTINQLMFYVILPNPVLMAEVAQHPEKVGPVLLVIDKAVEYYFFFVAAGVLWVALSYAERVRLAERQAAHYRSQAQAAQLRALRYQINPHFLFNTLNSLSALNLAGRNADAERMILNLSTFFRTSLAAEPEADVTLAEEVALQRLYLDIEKVRFPERLQVVIDVPPEAERVRLPGMILQPLIENAIKHGVALSKRPVTVTLAARIEGDRLRLTVEDDGAGDDLFGAAAPGTGTGFRNVCERLQARFGARAVCQSGPRPGGGWRVEIVVPRHA